MYSRSLMACVSTLQVLIVCSLIKEKYLQYIQIALRFGLNLCTHFSVPNQLAVSTAGSRSAPTIVADSPPRTDDSFRGFRPLDTSRNIRCEFQHLPLAHTRWAHIPSNAPLEKQPLDHAKIKKLLKQGVPAQATCYTYFGANSTLRTK